MAQCTPCLVVEKMIAHTFSMILKSTNLDNSVNDLCPDHTSIL